MLAQVKFCVVTELVFNLDLGGENPSIGWVSLTPFFTHNLVNYTESAWYWVVKMTFTLQSRG